MDILVFQKNGLLILGHASAPFAPIAPPENGKTFSRKTRMPQKGTIAICQKCQ
jgi:hypothetical protein